MNVATVNQPNTSTEAPAKKTANIAFCFNERKVPARQNNVIIAKIITRPTVIPPYKYSAVLTIPIFELIVFSMYTKSASVVYFNLFL